MTTTSGHRERLRKKFQENPNLLTESEQLELLLFYVIPRRDVTPIVNDLLERLENLVGVLNAPADVLMETEGVGETTVLFLHLLGRILIKMEEIENDMVYNNMSRSPQLRLFAKNSEAEDVVLTFAKQNEPPGVKERMKRVFANDEIANALRLLPQASNFLTLDDFKDYLQQELPYNAAETRQRRASYIIERFFPEHKIDTALVTYTSHCSGEADLRPVVFYHTLKAEPGAAAVVEDLIWPALPLGQVDRQQIIEFLQKRMPEVKHSSLNKFIQALYHTYDLCAVGKVSQQKLRIRLHPGTMNGFLYLLTSEYPKPGIYSFDHLFQGPIHRWLLWDEEWMINQLYNLQDLGILAKVSQIDTVRQFTMTMDQHSTLQEYFGRLAHKSIAVRDRSNDLKRGREG